MEFDYEIFPKKTFKGLCEDIYKNQSHRKNQIEVLLADLRPMIKTGNDALQIIPLIKQYLDCGIANDDHLIKLATIIQRIMSAQAQSEANGTSFGLSEEEKKELMATINDIQKSDVAIVKKITKKDD
jgi:hypothetical protein